MQLYYEGFSCRKIEIEINSKLKYRQINDIIKQHINIMKSRDVL